jgi:hypothetical protein
MTARPRWAGAGVAKSVGEPRGVTQQPPHRHLAVVELAFGESPPGQVGANGSVQVELSLLDERHNAPSGDPLAEGSGLEHGIHVHRFADGDRMDAVDRAIVEYGKHSVACVARLNELGSGGHEPGGIATRSEWLLPPAFRGPNEHRDGPQNEERESY